MNDVLQVYIQKPGPVTIKKTKTFHNIDKSILKSLPNSTGETGEIKIPEPTFRGVSEQPDFAMAYITLYPAKKIIELKS